MLAIDLAATFSADSAEPFTVTADFRVEEGETVVVLGPSGSGKTLLLETVAGFHDHEGTVRRNGTVCSDEPPEARDFGFVFQDYALFPHLTVAENVDFGTRYRETSREADELLGEFDIADLAGRYPPTLSGGEKQRVALARALAVDPDALLLDEPLSSLDVPTRQSLRADLGDVLADVTAIYVTHDRTTARALADRIVVMYDGSVVQIGTPEAVFEEPASPLVARFTGSNCLPLSAVPTLHQRLPEAAGDGDHLAVRPEAVRIRPEAGDGDLTATVERVTREDATSRVTLALATPDGPDGRVTLDAYTADPPATGATVGVSFDWPAVTVC